MNRNDKSENMEEGISAFRDIAEAISIETEWNDMFRKISLVCFDNSIALVSSKYHARKRD